MDIQGKADKLIQKLNDNLLIDDGKSFGEKKYYMGGI